MSIEGTNDSLERLTEIRNGNPEAIEDLWNRYGKRIQEIASKYLGAAPRRVMDSEDIKHIAFMSLVGFIQKFDPEDLPAQAGNGFSYDELKNGIWPIAFGIAKKKALMANRAANATKRSGGDDRVLTDESVFEDRAAEEPWVIASLEEQMKFLKDYASASQNQDLGSILQLRSEGMNSKEIATELGISEPSVSRRLKELRKALQEFGDISN